MPFAEPSSGVEIFYETHGEGAPLLLVSGTGHDHAFWSGQLPALSADYRCVVFDNRGVGRSAAPAPGYSLADMAEDAAGVLDAAGAARAHVMGFSMGGHIAAELALRHPERVLSLGLHHTWARNCARLGSFQRARMRLAARGEREALVELSLLGLYSHEFYDANADALEEKRKWIMEASGEDVGWEGQLAACLEGDTLDRLHRIKAPTLITCSDRDLIVDPHHAREMHARIEGSRLVVMEGTGHVALIECPDAFARVCREFLASLAD